VAAALERRNFHNFVAIFIILSHDGLFAASHIRTLVISDSYFRVVDSVRGGARVLMCRPAYL
jgi:hypothetical protein